MEKIFWIDKLGLFELAVLSVSAVFTGSSVRYDEKKASYAATRTLGWLKRFSLCENIYPASLTLDKKDDLGYAVNYRMEKELEECLDTICMRYLISVSDRFKGAARLYAALYLTYQCTFVVMVLTEPEYKSSSDRNVIYLRRHPLNSILVEHFCAKGHPVKESFFSLDCIVQSLKPLVRLAEVLISRVASSRSYVSGIAAKPAVWIEHVQCGWTDFTFWQNAVDRGSLDIVKYIDRNDGLSAAGQIEEIHRAGFKGIDIRGRELLRHADVGVKEIAGMLAPMMRADSGTPLWLKIFAFDYRMKHLIYRKVFERYSVKLLMQHQEASWIQIPQAQAIEDAGGIMIGFHWSNMPYYRIALLGYPQHVMFVWGKMMHDWIRKKGELCRYVLPAGLTLIPDKSEPVSMDLEGCAKFTIALFDSSVAYNIYQSEETLSQFYIRMLEMIDRHPDWYCLIKGKDRSEISDLGSLPHGGSIVELAMSLKRQGRLSMLSNKVPPMECAAKADISVCYSLNTAGIISALKGHRTIHWDCSGWLNNPILKDPDQKFVFHDLDAIEKVLEKVSGGDNTYGHLNGWKDRISAFDDDLASKRVGGFINDFMELSKEGVDVKQNLDKAVNKYLAANRVGDDFYGQPNMWEDEVTGVI